MKIRARGVSKMGKKDKEFSLTDLPGVGAATAEKLSEAGLDNLISIAVSSPSEFAEVSGLTENAARKLIQYARGRLEMDFESGEELLKKREQISRITTGSKAFDEILGGGVETGALTEAFGAFGSGKSSLAHQLAVSVQLPKEKGGAEGMAVWIDTEGTLRPEYIKQIAEARGLDGGEALKNFRGVRAFNTDHQMLLVENVEKLLKQGLNVKMIIVDSLMSLFRSDFSGRGQLADRQQKLNKHMHALLKLAHAYNIAVYCTNQVMAKPDVFFGDPTEAVGGHVLAHNCLTPDTLIQLADGGIMPISQLTGPSLLPAVDFKNMKQVPGFCDYGSKRSDIKKVYEIDTGNKIKASLGHRFFRLNDFQIEEVETQHLREGDFLMQVDAMTFEGKYQELPVIEHKQLIRITKEGSGLVKDEFERLNFTKNACEQLSVNSRQFRRILNQEYPTDAGIIAQLVQQGVNEQIHQYAEVVETHKYRALTLPSVLREDFAQILGYYFGDGNLEVSSLMFRDARKEVLEHYSSLCKGVFNLDGNVSKVKNKNCYQLSLNSIAVRELVSEIEHGLFLTISRSPLNVVRAFIKGFMDAEGCVSKRRARITLAQKDGQVLNYLQMLLLRFGIRASRRQAKTCEILLLDGRDFYDFAREIGVTALDKQEAMLKWMGHCEMTYEKEIIPVSRKSVLSLLKECGLKPFSLLKPRPSSYRFTARHHLEGIFAALQESNIPEECTGRVQMLGNLLYGNVRWEKIKHIHFVENNEPLYDISVPLLENYIANGFVVHNSTYRLYLRRGKKGTRVAKLIDAPARPENEAIFQVSNAGIEDV